MLTVPEAATRARRNPETIRRWIREGRLRARSVGTHHVIDEEDLAEAIGHHRDTVELPPEWRSTFWGGPMPDVVAAVRRSRDDLSRPNDDVDPDAPTVTKVLDGIPGAFERADRGSAEAAAGLGVPLEDLVGLLRMPQERQRE